MMRRICAVTLAATLLTTASVAAQTGPRVLTLTASTRALGLGGVFVLGSNDSDGVFHHTAFADRLRGAGISVQRYGGASTFMTASGAIDWWNGAVAVGVRALTYGSGTGVWDGLFDGEAGLMAGDGPHHSELAASLAYARRIRNVRLGVATHLVNEHVNLSHATTAFGDVTVGAIFGQVVTGLAVRNIGLAYDLDARHMDPPTLVTLSAARTAALAVGPIDILPVAALTYEFDGDFVPAGGVEVSYWPVSGRTFTLRLGARPADTGMRPFTIGAGFAGDRIVLDYAALPFDRSKCACGSLDETWSHRFGVRWR